MPKIIVWVSTLNDPTKVFMSPYFISGPVKLVTRSVVQNR